MTTHCHGCGRFLDATRFCPACQLRRGRNARWFDDCVRLRRRDDAPMVVRAWRRVLWAVGWAA